MTHSNSISVEDTNNESELDDLLEKVYLFGMNGGLGYGKFENELSPKEAKQALLSWRDKAVVDPIVQKISFHFAIPVKDIEKVLESKV